MLLSSMRSQTLHFAGYFPRRRSAGKTEAAVERDLIRLLFDAIDADSASRAAAKAPCLLE